MSERPLFGFFFLARPAATVYFVLMLTSVRATELTADWPTMEVGTLKEATAASRPSMAIEEIPSKSGGDTVQVSQKEKTADGNQI